MCYVLVTKYNYHLRPSRERVLPKSYYYLELNHHLCKTKSVARTVSLILNKRPLNFHFHICGGFVTAIKADRELTRDNDHPSADIVWRCWLSPYFDNETSYLKKVSPRQFYDQHTVPSEILSQLSINKNQ